MEDMNMALTLMAVGMTTVFLMLFLVVTGGNAIIAFVNRFVPEEEAKVKPALSGAKGSSATSALDDIRKMAVLTAAVQQVTQGRGRITKVEIRK
ncbi:oxaloacetate decarboxylase [Fulvitalea axinellae]|uniref:Oxaloacetate decarboxylase n=1 Tax=Fulvitalea axinellae TaxID=1182444 RepID=A0AAU9CJ39_9BACT|nr:oxaloacetate decarboxylase [Fulvitalea axinellae]